jgi:hypothetical protein
VRQALDIKEMRRLFLTCILLRKKLLNGEEIGRYQALVAHTCNPSYLGGRDQEDCGLKPVWANSFPDPKIPNTKKPGVCEALSSNSSTAPPK